MVNKLFTGVSIVSAVALLTCLSALFWHKRALAGEASGRLAEQSALRDQSTAEMALFLADAAVHSAEDKIRNDQSKASAASAGHAKTSDSWFKQSAQDPNLQNLKFAADRDHLKSRYRRLFDSLRLPGEKIDSFLEITAQYNQQKNDIYTSSDAQGISADDSAVRQLIQGSKKSYTDAIRQLLGSEGYADFQNYERTVDVRDVVSSISATAAMAGTSFTPSQSENLVAIFAEASPAYTRGQAAELYNIDWAKADLGVRAVLSPAQYDSYLNLEPTGTDYGGARGIAQLNQAIQKALALDKNEPSNRSSQP